MQYSVDDDARLWEHDGVRCRRAGDTAWVVAARRYNTPLYDTMTDAYMYKAKAQAERIRQLNTYIAEMERCDV